MRYSGRVSINDDTQQYILIDEEVSANDNKHQPPRRTVHRGDGYKLSSSELTFCVEEFGVSFDRSNTSDDVWLIKRAFTLERRNKSTGKLEVWKSHATNTGATVSSVVRIKSGPKYVGRIGQIRHFISLQNRAERTSFEFVTIDLYVSSLETDNDSGLLHIDTINLEEKAFPLGHISKAIVTAVDDENPNVMWLLNCRNV